MVRLQNLNKWKIFYLHSSSNQTLTIFSHIKWVCVMHDINMTYMVIPTISGKAYRPPHPSKGHMTVSPFHVNVGRISLSGLLAQICISLQYDSYKTYTYLSAPWMSQTLIWIRVWLGPNVWRDWIFVSSKDFPKIQVTFFLRVAQ